MSLRDEPELESFQDEYWGPSGSLHLDRRDFLKVLGGGCSSASLAPPRGRRSQAVPSAAMSFPKMWARGCILRPMAR